MNLHDVSALDHSKNLAMVKIEDMEDYEAVKALVTNANDIRSRASSRLRELLHDNRVPEMTWFTVTDIIDDKQYQAMWLDRQKNGKKAKCDNCGKWVAGKLRRLLVDNGQGQYRNGHQHQFVCMECASARWGA